jgi:hypothetical protein
MHETVTAGTSPGGVVAHAPHPHTLPFYTIPDDALEFGASFGNSALWVTTKGTGAIDRVFSIDAGQTLINNISIRYASPGHRVQTDEHGVCHISSVDPHGASYVSLRQDTPGTFEIHPAYQRHSYVLTDAIGVTETVFLPLASGGSDDAAAHAAVGDPPILYQTVELRNDSPVPRDLRVFGYARLRGTLPDDMVARYDADLRALVAHNKSRPACMRVFGLTEQPSGYGTTFDFGRVYDPLHVRPLDNATDASGDILGGLQLDVHLAPGESRRFTFITALSATGEDDAVAAYRAAGDPAAALQDTTDHLVQTLSRALVLTPDPLINQGALWSKVNMRRVMARYPQGPAFTNEPGVSSNVVGRDMAWFVYGNDHFKPAFSRALLDTFARLQYEDGRIAEYYSALDGRVEDYGLNINDDTPLFILAVNHHYRATGDAEWLRAIYPAVAKAARYIVAQEDARGLVFCTAKDPRGNVWAIAGWRNVIPQYSLNGAVTEINAECVAALRAAGHLAENLGLPEAEARAFFDAAQKLRDAMNTHLLNPENGLYYLNIDADGNVHTDVTGDEVFPVMFRVCDDETGFRIISRLNSPDFWTPAGLRTASRLDPLYDPFAFVGLSGGVWPGLTWWYAFAAARYHPEFMVAALRSSFAHYAVNPKNNNTVPGQFSEWFDGESLINRGMRLSPWEPPRFLWAAVEGVCGLMLTPDLPQVNPLVPPEWKWVALRRQPYHGHEMTYFATRQDDRAFHIYADTALRSDHHVETYDEDISARVYAYAASAEVVALRRPGEIVVLIGNVGAQTSVVPVAMQDVIDADTTYDLRIYNSERGVWDGAIRQQGHDLSPLAVQIETNGFRIIEITGGS